MAENSVKQSLDSTVGEGLSAGVFQNLLADFASARVYDEGERQGAAAERRLEEVREMIEQHTTDEPRRELLHRAREAAQHGEHESLLLRSRAILTMRLAFTRSRA
ncbi:MAG: hypothetical protein JO212_19980 [Acetobacteraceae bacterium]|nr:hypothetical protein [Acetobacteraceae bacterium]